MPNEDNRLLLGALAANAGFSLLSAVVLLAAGGWISDQLGLARIWLTAVAAGLVLFGWQLIAIVRSGRINSREVAAIIAADLLWVAASGVALWLFHPQLTVSGIVLVAGTALAVFVFAELQSLGLWRWLKSRQTANA